MSSFERNLACYALVFAGLIGCAMAIAEFVKS